jgi:hypothetical protein
MPTLIEAIGKGELDAVMQKIKLLNTENFGNIILLLGQYSSLKKDEHSGAYEEDDLRRRRARITNSLLYYIGEYEWGNEEVILKSSTSSSKVETNKKIKILFLAVNPIGTSNMRLGKEAREIEERLKRSKLRDDFEFESKWAVRPNDLLSYILEIKPDIVHFSGHGSEDQGLIFEDNNEKKFPISPEAINKLFALAVKRAPMKCVLLNACYSAEQAKGIAKSIDYVIGMTNAIWDKSAIAFSTGFYDSLGTGDSVDIAYETGVLSIELNGFDGVDYPVLHQKGN